MGYGVERWWPAKRQKGTFWSGWNSLYIDEGDRYMTVYFCQNSSNFTIKIIPCQSKLLKLYFFKKLNMKTKWEVKVPESA